MSTEYEYAFGQWVITKAGVKCRYLIKDSDDDVVLLDTEIQDSEYLPMEYIRPDPDPPELVPGQLVMVRDNTNEDWEGPYKYSGFGNESDRFPHSISDDIHRYAKPYIPEPETPESERPTTEQRLDSLEKRIAEIVTQIQTLKTNTKP